MKRAETLYPRATAFIKGCTLQALNEWLTLYPIGREALAKLETKLTSEAPKNGCFEIIIDG